MLPGSFLPYFIKNTCADVLPRRCRDYHPMSLRRWSTPNQDIPTRKHIRNNDVSNVLPVNQDMTSVAFAQSIALAEIANHTTSTIENHTGS